MRLDDCREEEFPGEYALFQANVRRAVAGKRGRAALLELEQALLALPSKRLIANHLVHDGEVCAVGAAILHRKMQHGATLDDALAAITKIQDDAWEWDVTVEAGRAHAALPYMVAWRCVELNDYQFVYATPEQRYKCMLTWVRDRLAGKPEEE